MNTLKEIIKSPSTIVVDVRSPWEYETEHFPEAKNIPLEEIITRLEELKKMKIPMVLYCLSGNRSGMAVNLLKQYGITEVYNGGSLDEMKIYLN